MTSSTMSMTMLIRPADLRLFSKVREPCECERERDPEGMKRNNMPENPIRPDSS